MTSSRSRRRAHRTRLAPSAANRRAQAAPIPEEAPVMRMVFPAILVMRKCSSGSRLGSLPSLHAEPCLPRRHAAHRLASPPPAARRTADLQLADPLDGALLGHHTTLCRGAGTGVRPGAGDRPARGPQPPPLGARGGPGQCGRAGERPGHDNRPPSQRARHRRPLDHRLHEEGSWHADRIGPGDRPGDRRGGGPRLRIGGDRRDRRRGSPGHGAVASGTDPPRVSTLDTPLTRDAGIAVPLICGAMYPCSNPELVAAVSDAGGIGIAQPLSMVYVHGHEFREGLRLIRRLTTKPIGMNVLIEQSSRAYLDKMRRWLDVALEEGVRFFVTSLGNPRWVVDRVRPVGGVVYHDVTERKWALKALDGGVKGLIGVNNRAGGHAGARSAEELF